MNYELIHSVPGASETFILPGELEKAFEVKRNKIIEERSETENKLTKEHELRLKTISSETYVKCSQLPQPELKKNNLSKARKNILPLIAFLVVYFLIMMAITRSISWLQTYMVVLMIASVAFALFNYARIAKRAEKDKKEYEDAVTGRENQIGDIQREGDLKAEHENLMHETALNDLMKKYSLVLDTFDRDVRECMDFYRSEYKMNRTNSRNRFRGELEKQDFGVCTWMSGEIISFLESLKGKMEDSAFLRRAKYEFSVSATGDNVTVEISGFEIEESYKDRRYFKKYDYFTANESVIPNNSPVEKWGYCAAIIDLVRAEVTSWLKNYEMSGAVLPDITDEKLDGGRFSLVFDTAY